MSGKRTEKVSGMLQEELASIFLQQGSAWWGNSFITISAVKVTPDLGEAWVYLSMFHQKNRDQIMNVVQQHVKEIRHELARRIKNQVRVIPNLKFFLDETLDQVQKMEDLLKTIDLTHETKINEDDYKK